MDAGATDRWCCQPRDQGVCLMPRPTLGERPMTAAERSARRHGPLACQMQRRVTIFPGMFCVSEAEAAAIRAAYEQGGELSAAIELRRLFPGITDTAKARECARTIAGWSPLPD